MLQVPVCLKRPDHMCRCCAQMQRLHLQALTQIPVVQETRQHAEVVLSMIVNIGVVLWNSYDGET
jgi:hypothetical protein